MELQRKQMHGMLNKKIQKVSVIILTYNQMDYLYDAIKSVLNQDYPNIELIVSDDASCNFQKGIYRIAGRAFRKVFLKKKLKKPEQDELLTGALLRCIRSFCSGLYHILLRYRSNKQILYCRPKRTSDGAGRLTRCRLRFHLCAFSVR